MYLYMNTGKTVENQYISSTNGSLPWQTSDRIFDAIFLTCEVKETPFSRVIFVLLAFFCS